LKLLKEEEISLNDFQNTFKNKVLELLLTKEGTLTLHIIPAFLKVEKDIIGF